MHYENRHGIGVDRNGFLPLCASLAIAASTFAFFGCSSFSSKSISAEQEQGRIYALTHELKRERNLIEELKDRNLILEHKLAVHHVQKEEDVPATQAPIPFEPSAAFERPAPDLTPDLQMTSANAQSEEQQLYTKIADSYRRHSPSEMESNLKFFLKLYPDSVFADNALYQAGLLQFENDNLERAEYYMNRVLKEFPNGDKSVSALFAKAMIEKRKQQFSLARHFLNEVRRDYPGSPEAVRVVVELKILDLTMKKPRES